MSSITQPFARITTFNRNSSGVLQSITVPNGTIIPVSINTKGYLTSVSNPNSEIHSMTYHGTTGGLLKTFTRPNGDTTTLTYDNKGNLLTDIHTNGFGLTLSRNDDLVTTTSAEGIVRTNHYDYQTNVESFTDASGLTTDISSIPTSFSKATQINNLNLAFGPDPRFPWQENKLVSSTLNNFGVRTGSHSKSVVLNTSGNPFSINTMTMVDTVGASQITKTFTGANNTWSWATKEGRTRALTIDSFERPVTEQLGNLTPKNYIYTNELLTKISQGTRDLDFTYNTKKLLQSVKNELNQITTFTYDASNRLLTQTLPDLRVINFSYDSSGNLTSVTPPSRPIHTMVYGLNEKIEEYIPPSLAGVTSVNTLYSYDLDSRLIQIDRPDGEVINLNYNPSSGLLDSISGAFGAITATYNLGLPFTITDQSGAEISNFYTGNVIKEVSLDKSGPVYTYLRSPDSNAGEKIGSETINGEGSGSVQRTFNYTYDDDEILTGIGNLSLSYNMPNGLLTGTTLGNITDNYSYNTFGEIIQYEAKFASSTIYQIDLVRDGLGRITKKTELLNGVTSVFDYAYDNVGRLVQVDKNGSTISTYLYDDNSNRVGGLIAGTTTSATYDNQDRLLSYNGVARTYNPNGELISIGSTSLSYDVFGNLKNYVNGSSSLDYEIDPLQRRLGYTVNGIAASRVRFIYSPEGKLVGLLDNANILKKTFGYGAKAHVPDFFVDSNGNEFRIITDHLGSIRLVLNANTGVVSQIMEHDSFGNVIQDTNPGFTPFGFAGGLYNHQSGLVRFGARDYDSQTGRWTAKDPILFAGKMLNFYGYSFSDPVNFVDPSGLAPGDVFNSESAAGYDAIKYINDASIFHNREFAGTINRNASGGYSYTIPRRGGVDGANPGPISANTVAIYHTHAGYDPRYDNEIFSNTDTRFSTGRGLGSYLGTPFGSIQYQGPNGNTTNMSGPNSCGR